MKIKIKKKQRILAESGSTDILMMNTILSQKKMVLDQELHIN